tara:strand:+ start:20932 stop:21882 length:951 start_codon:yes stop_codon:yes gene_type:complete
MSKVDKNYKDLLDKIVKQGFRYEDPNRKNVYRIQIPTYTFKHSFKDGFPAITTKRLYWKGIVGELIWFLRGDTNIKYLQDNKIHIWDKDAANFSDNGDLGRVYGAQWRRWRHREGYINLDVDQISNLIKNLKETPMGTQHIVNAWNPAELKRMALPPCHWSFEVVVQPLTENESQEYLCEGKTDGPKYGFTLKWNQRSVDTFLGLPFNIASYALLAQILGEITGMAPLAIQGNLSNVHLYETHLEKAKTQISRSTNFWNSETEFNLSPSVKKLCTLYNKDDITLDAVFNGMTINDFTLPGYSAQPSIKATMIARDN